MHKNYGSKYIKTMQNSSPKISIAVPIHHGMKHFQFFFDRLMHSIEIQSFRDFEIVVTEEGSMPVNTNAAIKKSRGEIVKILYLDDYLAHKHSLRNIVEAFDSNTEWLVTGCLHQEYIRGGYEDPHSPHYPEYTTDIHTGNNRLGSPSVLALRNNEPLLFDEKLSYFLDCDLYRRYYDKFGAPKILNDLNVVIGIHDGQTSQTMPLDDKLEEFYYMQAKYAN